MSTIYTLLSTDLINDTFDDINTNFSNLNTDKADDSAVVHDTGNETIAGVKTFSSPLITNGAINFNAPEGFLINGKIVPSVTGGNLTVAIKTLAGTDPSATDPVYVRIGDVVRSITSALSLTKVSGTSYLNLGSAELATKEVDLFVYLRWDTGANVVCLDVSRIPNATRTGDFTQNDTGEKGYFVSSFAGSAVTDVEVNIGRFNATLSAGGAYTWSIPATSVIINRPIYETRVLESNANAQGFSSLTANILKYKISLNTVIILGPNAIEGTSNATTFSFSLPFATNSAYSSNGFSPVFVKDNGTNQSVVGHMDNSGGTATTNVFKTFYGGVWTASGAKSMFLSKVTYQI